MIAVALFPLETAPKQPLKNGISAKFVFYFAPVLKRLMRKQAGSAGSFSWFFFCCQKKNGKSFWKMDSGLKPE